MIGTPIHMRQKEEDLILLRLIFDRKDFLFSYLNPQLTSEDKYENWSTIFEECRRLKQYWLSEKNSYGRIADVNYLRHVKWKRLKGETLNKLESYAQSTNTLPTLNEVDHLILDIIGRENIPYLVNASASKIDWQWIERSQTNQQSKALTRPKINHDLYNRNPVNDASSESLIEEIEDYEAKCHYMKRMLKIEPLKQLEKSLEIAKLCKELNMPLPISILHPSFVKHYNKSIRTHPTGNTNSNKKNEVEISEDMFE